MMLSERFGEEFPANEQKLNVVICVFHKDAELEDKSPLNQMLEELQFKLKKELERYKEIQVAYVFHDDNLNVREFEKLEKSTPIYYKELSQSYNFAHIWLMGMVLLEREQQEEKKTKFTVENRIYLVTDAKLPRDKVRLIIEERRGLRMHSRFEQLDFRPFLWRSEEAKGDILEEYIEKEGETPYIWKRENKNV